MSFSLYLESVRRQVRRASVISEFLSLDRTRMKESLIPVPRPDLSVSPSPVFSLSFFSFLFSFLASLLCPTMRRKYGLLSLTKLTT